MPRTHVTRWKYVPSPSGDIPADRRHPREPDGRETAMFSTHRPSRATATVALGSPLGNLLRKTRKHMRKCSGHRATCFQWALDNSPAEICWRRWGLAVELVHVPWPTRQYSTCRCGCLPACCGTFNPVVQFRVAAAPPRRTPRPVVRLRSDVARSYPQPVRTTR